MDESTRTKPGFQGLRVLSLESRNAAQMAKLIETQGGEAVSAPSMREIPLDENPEAFRFADDLFASHFDIAVFLTGVGTRALFTAIETRHPRKVFVDALSRIAIIARGPKPAAVLREFAIPISFIVPEPNTWRDLVAAVDQNAAFSPLAGKRIAIQEYGIPNEELSRSLQSRGASVTSVPVYQWAMPEDIGPLQRAVEEIAANRIDVLLITSATQVHHMMKVAAQADVAGKVRQALRGVMVASIGPISSEALRADGIEPDLEPTHPKMGQLVFEAAGMAGALLRKKRGQIA